MTKKAKKAPAKKAGAKNPFPFAKTVKAKAKTAKKSAAKPAPLDMTKFLTKPNY